MFQLAVTYMKRLPAGAALDSVGRWHALSLRNAAYKYRTWGRLWSTEYFQKVVEIRDRLVFQNPAVSSLRAEHYQDLLVLADHMKLMGRTSKPTGRTATQRRPFTAGRKSQTQRSCFNWLWSTLLWPQMLRLRRRLKRLKILRPLMNVSETQTFAMYVAAGCRAGLGRSGGPQELQDAGSARNRRFSAAGKVVESVPRPTSCCQPGANGRRQLADQKKAVEILSNLAAGESRTSSASACAGDVPSLHGRRADGLKQFDEAEKSLKEALRCGTSSRHTAGRSRVNARLLTAAWPRDNCLWQQGKFPEAHQLWQECLTLYAVPPNRQDSNASLFHRHVTIVRSIFERYAEYGLWQIAMAHGEQIVASARRRGVTQGEQAIIGLVERPSDLMSATYYFSSMIYPTQRYLRVSFEKNMALIMPIFLG